MKHIQQIVASGYLLVTLLIGCIAYIWHNEWQEVEELEYNNRQIDDFRKDINNIHIRLIEFSLLGETILEWDNEDLEHYHDQRMAMDSMLCHIKTIYPAEHIDSVRHLLEDKERQMCQIVQVLEQQQAINDKITRQVPVIAQKSVQNNPRNPNEKDSWASSVKKRKQNPQ